MSRILPVWGRSGSTSATAVELSTFLQKRRCSKRGQRPSNRKGFEREWLARTQVMRG